MTTPSPQLAQRYSRAVPRYTSYPTVPDWGLPPSAEEWVTSLQTSAAQGAVALYIHLPFCESLCHFCGCTKVITKNHSIEEKYIDHLLTEWSHTAQLLPPGTTLSQLHLGGGTPTFFSPENLLKLAGGILEKIPLAPSADVSFEAHPTVTTRDHMKHLRTCGFNRVSFGVQDVSEEVLTAIGRNQPLESLEQCLAWAQELGYHSINVDLIYGLPNQTLATLDQTLDFVQRTRPHRIAFYSYAHLPYLKPSQRRIEQCHLPSPEDKLQLQNRGRQRFKDMGYVELGFDHFALPEDALATALQQQKLHRNFMGYTVQKAPLLIGLGMSAISQTEQWYAQNPKDLSAYTKGCHTPFSSFMAGCRINLTDAWCQQRILELSCQLATHFPISTCPLPLSRLIAGLHELEQDGLLGLSYGPQHIKVSITPQGVPFLRHVCYLFDHRANGNRQGFSSGV